MKINNTIAKFKFESIGEMTAQSYFGMFKTKCVLSIAEEIEADRLYREHLGDNLLYASQKAKELAFAISQLSVRVVEAPYFWTDLKNGENCLDKNIVFDLFTKSLEAQDKFLDSKREEFKQKQDRLTKLLKDGEITEEVEETEENGAVDDL